MNRSRYPIFKTRFMLNPVVMAASKMVSAAILKISPNTPAIKAKRIQDSSFPYTFDKEASNPIDISGIEIITIACRSKINPNIIEKMTMKSKNSMDFCITILGLFVICFKSTSIPAKNMR